MSGMGLLLADWSIELIRSRRRKGKKLSKKSKKKSLVTADRDVQTGDFPCYTCSERSDQLLFYEEQLSQLHQEKKQLQQLVEAVGQLEEVDEEGQVSATAGDLLELVSHLVGEVREGREEEQTLREERVKMAECVGRQLAERDSAHSERVKALELMMAEKERQLQRTAGQLRQQLDEAQLRAEQLSAREQQLLQVERTVGAAEQSSWEQEIDSLKIVLDMKREETDQLRSANNRLMMDLEHFAGVELRLEEARQRLEETTEVVHRKNDELRQLLEEYDGVQSQLEDEVKAHLACQQQLEKTQWTIENFVSKRDKGPVGENRPKDSVRTRNEKNKKEERNGLILDVVQKNESVAWSFNIPDKC